MNRRKIKRGILLTVNNDCESIIILNVLKLLTNFKVFFTSNKENFLLRAGTDLQRNASIKVTLCTIFSLNIFIQRYFQGTKGYLLVDDKLR